MTITVVYANSTTKTSITGFTATTAAPNTFVVPNTVTAIAATAFSATAYVSARTRITAFTFQTNSTFRAIPANLFANCTALASVIFPATTSITSIGNTAFQNCTSLTNITLPGIVTTIGTSVFSGCSKLPSINIPSGVTIIPDSFCSGCSLLNTVNYGNINNIIAINQSAFLNCSSLTNIPFFPNLQYIQHFTFQGCTKITSVIFPSTFGALSVGTFQGCSLLNTVIFQGNLMGSISTNTFLSCVALTKIIIPSSVTVIGATAFSGCTALKDITLLRKNTETLTIFNSNCFLNTGITEAEYGSALEMFNNGYTQAQLTTTAGIAAAVFTRVTRVMNFLKLSVSKTNITSCDSSFDPGNVTLFIPSSVTSIGPSAFLNRPITSFTSLKFIGNGIVTINSSAFQGCTALSSTSLPDSLISINSNAFKGCTNLNMVMLERTSALGLTTLGSDCFSGLGFTTTNYVSVTNMYSMGYKRAELITTGISTNILDLVFPGGIEITVDVNGVLTSASYQYGSGSLEIPSSVVAIGFNAFLNLSALQIVIIPNTVTSIGNNAFKGCLNLTSVTLQRTSAQGLTILGTDCFSGVKFTTTNYVSVTNMYSMGYITDQLTTSGISTPVLNKAISDAFFVFNNPATKTEITGFNSAINISGFTLEIPSSVISIAASAFLNCVALTNITFLRTIAQGLTTLGPNCFSGVGFTTSNYQSITTMIGQGYTTDNLTAAGISSTIVDLALNDFRNNALIYNVDKTSIIGYNNTINFTGINISFPTSVTIIGDNAFINCVTLTNVTISSSITTISASAFQGCTALVTIFIPSSVRTIGNSAFSGCSGLTSVSFQSTSTLTSIGDSAFSGCNKILSLTIPTSVITISTSTFQGCSALQSLIIYSSVTTIGNSAFSGCSGLTSVQFQSISTLTSIGDFAFSGCNKIPSLTIPTSVASIGNSAFSGCTNLSALTLERTSAQGLTSLGTDCFLNVKFTITTLSPVINMYTMGYTTSNLITAGITIIVLNKAVVDFFFVFSDATKQAITGFNSAVSVAGLTPEIPTTVNTINSNAFQGCSTLNQIIIPSTVTSIGNNIFLGCPALISVTFLNNITTIPSSMFQDCIVLNQVTIPGTVTLINSNAFQGCSTLNQITIPSSVTRIATNVFSGCSSLTSVTFQRTSAQGLTILETNCFLNAGFTDINFTSVTNMYTIGYTTANLTTAGISITVLNKAVGNAFFVFSDSNKISITGFNSAVNITGITPEIPSSVTSIGDSAFLNCLSLTSVTISINVISIGNTAFSGCTALTTVTLLRTSAQTLTTFGTNCFLNVGFTTINFTSVVNMYKMGYVRDNLVTAGISLAVIDIFFIFNGNRTSITGCRSTINATDINLEIPNTVTSLATNAFQNYFTLSKITISSNITSIGSNAFQNTALISISIPNLATLGSNVFSGCASLTSVSILGSITIIDNTMFSGCSVLTLISIPTSVITINSNAFLNCRALNSIIFPNIITINDSAFKGCSGLTSISFLNLRTLGINAFQNCDALTSVSFPNLTIINYNAFLNCKLLNNITIPSSVTLIDSNAFSGCSALINITLQRTIAQGLTILGSSCFLNAGFTDINFTSVTNMYKIGYTRSHLIAAGISLLVANNALIDAFLVFSDSNKITINSYDPSVNVSGITIEIPTGVTSIDVNAFLNCTTLSSVIISINVISIGSNAFKGCLNLTSVTLQRTSQGLTILGTDCFSGVKFTTTNYVSVTNMYSMGYTTDQLTTSGILENVRKLAIADAFLIFNDATKTSVIGFNSAINVSGITPEIPTSVTSIAASAFLNCLTLTNIKILNENIISIDASAFQNCSVLTSVEIYSYVIRIDTSAFQNCTALTNLYIQGNDTIIGTSAFQGCAALINVTISSGLLIIGTTAFKGCSALIDIIIYGSIERIGIRAFQDCTALTSVSLGSFPILDTECFLNTGFNEPNFQSVKNLLDSGYTRNNLITAGILITVIDKVILDALFSFSEDKTILLGCNTLNDAYAGINVIIPSGVIRIGEYAFYGITNLPNITIPNTVISIGYSAFQGCELLTHLIIPTSVTLIEYNAFSYCSALTDITLQRTSSQQLTILESNCFLNIGISESNYTSVMNMYSMGYTRDELLAAGFSSFVVDNAINDINDINAFLIFNNATKTIVTGFNSAIDISGINVYFPTSVTSIAANAFLNCTTLSSVTFSTNVISIGNNAFKGCSNLTTAAIPASVATIGTSIFQNCGFTSYNWPSTLPTINDYTFAGCIDLTSVIIQSGVTTIKTYVFNGCFALTSVSIPATVNAIGNNTFQMCGFIEFTWPNIITKINDYMFADCIYLQRIKIIPTVPQVKYTLGKFVFKNCPSLRF